MSEEDTANKEENSTTIASVFGEIAWLMAQSKRHRYNFFLADLEWLVMPPVMENQCRIFHQDGKPVGVAFWAFVNEETNARLTEGVEKLKLNEWNNGKQAWLIDIIAPFGQADKMIDELKTTVLSNHVFKSFFVKKDGRREVIEYIGIKKQN